MPTAQLFHKQIRMPNGEEYIVAVVAKDEHERDRLLKVRDRKRVYVYNQCRRASVPTDTE